MLPAFQQFIKKNDVMPQNVHFLNLADFSNNIYFGTLKLKHLGQIPTIFNWVHFLFFWFTGLRAFSSFLVLKVTTYFIWITPKCKIACYNTNRKHKCLKSFNCVYIFFWAFSHESLSKLWFSLWTFCQISQQQKRLCSITNLVVSGKSF